MPEVKTTVQPFRFDYTCDECGKGKMRGTGWAHLSSPPQYPHRCDVCGAEKTFVGASYPRVEFVDSTDANEALTEVDRNAVIALRATADAIEKREHTLSPHSTWEVTFGPNQRPDRFRCDLLFIGPP